MILAKVVSRVVASARHAGLPSRPLLSVEPLPAFREGGARVPLIAIDGVQAGPGDTVLVMQEGSGARQVVLQDPALPLPAQAVIVGIVDHVQS